MTTEINKGCRYITLMCNFYNEHIVEKIIIENNYIDDWTQAKTFPTTEANGMNYRSL